MIPSQVNLFGTMFRVELVDGLDECGHTIVCDRVIRIGKELTPPVQVETFYHELVHVILAHMGLDYMLQEETTEELFAQGLGMALTYLISTNQLPSIGTGESK